MKRKVSKIGQSTLMVSLPHQWVKEHNLKKGDEVEVSIHQQQLLISAEKGLKKEEKKEAHVTFASSYEKMIRITLNDLYRMGYDRIVVSYTHPETLEIVRHIVADYLLGFEVVSEEKEKCIIESLTEPNPEKAESLLRKVFFIIQESILVMAEDIEKESLHRVSTLYELMIRCDRFCNFYARTLFKENRLSPFVWTTVIELLHIEHCIYYCYKTLLSCSPQVFDKQIRAFFEIIQTQFIELESLFYKNDTNNLEKTLQQTDSLLYKEIAKLQKTKNGIFVSPYFYDILKTMHSARVSIIGTRIQERTGSATFHFR